MTRGTEETGNIERQESQWRKERQVIEKRQGETGETKKTEETEEFFLQTNTADAFVWRVRTSL